jgi:hypothetical protein
MNKKLIALAMVLLLAVGGLFAAAYTGTLPGAVTATLNANIGDYLYHGFVDASAPTGFLSTKVIADAFITDPVFNYGYKTNISETYSFEFRMIVGDFVHNDTDVSAVIKIADVLIDNVPAYPITGYYLLLSKTGAETQESVAVKIQPAKAAGLDHLNVSIGASEYYGSETAVAGAYTSTVTISVVSLS